MLKKNTIIVLPKEKILLTSECGFGHVPIDIVKNKIYEGGVIAPGVSQSIKNLSQSTALLPMFSLRNKQNTFGKNTKEALNAGFLWGYEGLINNIINKITKNWKMNYKIILTGGYAKLFTSIIKKKTIIDPNITIKGVSKVYREFYE